MSNSLCHLLVEFVGVFRFGCSGTFARRWPCRSAPRVWEWDHAGVPFFLQVAALLTNFLFARPSLVASVVRLVATHWRKWPDTIDPWPSVLFPVYSFSCRIDAIVWLRGVISLLLYRGPSLSDAAVVSVERVCATAGSSRMRFQ